MKYYETGFRLSKDRKKALRGKGLYVYERRENGREDTIENHVAVDFMGTLITDFPIAFETKGPFAYVIWDGDTFLEAIGAEEVNRTDDLEPNAEGNDEPQPSVPYQWLAG